MTINLPTNYPALLGEIKQRIYAAQYEALKAVNKELIALKKKGSSLPLTLSPQISQINGRKAQRL